MISWLTATPSYRLGFTDVRGGYSAGPYSSFNLGTHVGDDPQSVAANRDLLGWLCGQEVVWMDQVHGADFAYARAAKPGRFRNVGQADAIIVEPGQCAAVMVADCIPLILVSKDARLGAVVHVGRAGLEKRIATAVLNELNCEVDAFIGPAICTRCYEVSEELAAKFGNAKTAAGTAAIDLVGTLEKELAGRVASIWKADTCTLESELHFSHRGSQPSGRFAGVLQIF